MRQVFSIHLECLGICLVRRCVGEGYINWWMRGWVFYRKKGITTSKIFGGNVEIRRSCDSDLVLEIGERFIVGASYGLDLEGVGVLLSSVRLLSGIGVLLVFIYLSYYVSKELKMRNLYT